MKYDGYIFPILWWENGHVLLRSEFRKDMAHIVEHNNKTWKCSCENAQIDKNEECKHIRFVKWMEKAVHEHYVNRKITGAPESDQQ